ncbi:hypothetical protein CCACVL1_26150 [Corchorus capsularis]|uniref:Replication factor C subunit 3 n=1 Tax=Corchorus capsularis TaxID=210143 RepID=A0A1R3GFU9_COCAP|nr:hypothetical protein CCACVL1_26150 [Corchorus capsularis]
MENLSRSSKASQQRRSGYEPSDTETEWHESPWHDHNNQKNNGTSNLHEAEKLDLDLPRKNLSPLKLNRRHNSSKVSPPRTTGPLPRRHSSKSPYKTTRRSDDVRNISPLPKPEHRRHVSPYKNHEKSRKTPTRDERPTIGQLLDAGRTNENPNYFRRSVTAPRQRGREKEQQKNHERAASPISSNVIRKQREVSNVKAPPSVGEINEMVANAKISKSPIYNAAIFESTESISPGDIFFSRDGVPMATQKNVLPNNGLPKPPMFAQNDSAAANQRMRSGNGKVDPKARGSSSSAAGLSRTSRQSSTSLNGFTCHKQEAQLLKQLVSDENCPNILFKGPSGSGKKALTMAFLREIYGDPCWNDKKPTQVTVPLASSAHHVELNVNLETNAKYALMGLVKEISTNYAIPPEVSTLNFKADYKVIVLYEVDKAPENIHHLIKWIMDCHSDSCKFVLCCEDDIDILESVKNRCKTIKLDAPVTHEIMEVLIQIARKEEFDLSMNFAAKIAAKSKQNLRKAIMALEACKSHSYPFADDQPIPFGWEEVLTEIATEILADPSQKRLYFVRPKLQKLLVDFVHPKLILQKLIEHFLKHVDAGLKRELYYWHAYYDKRLPTGTSALLKLEEFVAKFMGIYRKSSGNHQFA